MIQVAIGCAFYPNYFSQIKHDEGDAMKKLSGKSPLNTVYLRGLPNDQGLLYKRQIESMIKRMVPEAKIHISFENTRSGPNTLI